VYGDAVGSITLNVQGSPNQIGIVSSTAIPQRGYFVDIDRQFCLVFHGGITLKG
jgi:hypothetical protein